MKRIEIFLDYSTRGKKMAYLFQIILLVGVLACAMLTEAFWSWSDLGGEKRPGNWYPKLVAAGCGFVAYSLIDYSMLDYLMLIPGAKYVIA